MRRILRVAPYLSALAFAAWCGLALKGDLAQLSEGRYGAGSLGSPAGGLGSTEAVMTALLAAQGYPLSQAIVITLTCRLVTLWLAVALGWGAVLSLRQRTSALEPGPSRQAADS